MPSVLVPIATGFEEIEAISIIDVLRRAGIKVILGTLNENPLVKGANGITIQADCPIRTLCVDDLDMIVLPGGLGGTNALASDSTLQALLQSMDAEGKDIGAICAAPYALYTAGVLKEGYTGYPGVEEQIEMAGYRGDESAVVQSGNIMTSRGPGTAICFALAIVKKLVGEEKSESVRGGLLADYCATL
jgi:4-methyl-5(b-hydroxyethyl)-thiazole monophosphate biosynthesis